MQDTHSSTYLCRRIVAYRSRGWKHVSRATVSPEYTCRSHCMWQLGRNLPGHHWLPLQYFIPQLVIFWVVCHHCLGGVDLSNSARAVLPGPCYIGPDQRRVGLRTRSKHCRVAVHIARESVAAAGAEAWICIEPNAAKFGVSIVKTALVWRLCHSKRIVVVKGWVECSSGRGPESGVLLLRLLLLLVYKALTALIKNAGPAHHGTTIAATTTSCWILFVADLWAGWPYSAASFACFHQALLCTCLVSAYWTRPCPNAAAAATAVSEQIYSRVRKSRVRLLLLRLDKSSSSTTES